MYGQCMLGILAFTCCIMGCSCFLVITPTTSTLVNALVGSNVTLTVTISGESAPIVSWSLGTLTLTTWTLGSSAPPDIAVNYKEVLSVDVRGSLVFTNIPLYCSGTYTMTTAKPGVHEASVNFTLFVYDIIKDVSMHTSAQDAIEGGPAFTLSYKLMQGSATASKWLFNGLDLADGLRYSITEKGLTIKKPSRNDTGQYTVVLTNPFSSERQHRDITVLYGPDLPVLEVSPAKAAFHSGDSFSLSCRAEGEPAPSASWVFNSQTLPTSSNGTLKLTDVQPSQSGTYVCLLVNMKTNARLERNITIDVRGLSGSAIAAISAGIPCAIILLIILIGLIALCVNCYKKKDRNPRYPVSRAVEKAAISHPDLTMPIKLLTNGLKLPPDYTLHHQQVLPERAFQLPLQPAPVRMATTV